MRNMLLLSLFVVTSRGADPTKLKPEVFQKWGQAETVVAAKLTRVVAGPVGFSEPPLYTFQLHLQIDKVLRGPLKKGELLTASFSIRQKEPPKFPEGKDCLVSLSFVRGNWVVKVIEEAKEEDVAQATAATAVPLGWTMEQGRFLSPWAKLGKGAWPTDAKLTGTPLCSVTGRPGLLVGPGIEYSVEKVPPKKEIQFANPDGDGEYKITVKNIGEKAVVVPALLTDGKTILWEESLAILCQNKVYPIPGAKGIKGDVKSVTLKPGEAVSTVVNALKLEGPMWPQGGYRIEFTFCLGERSVTQSFYYLSRHHDPIRKAMLKNP